VEYYLDYFAQEYNKKRKTLADEALRFLTDDYPWPGNIRELKNLIERLNILSTGNPITLQDIKNNVSHYEERFAVDDSKPLKGAVEEFQRSFIVSALRRNGFNIMKTSEQLKVERSNLYKLLKRLGIKTKQ
jgi:two-component system nitrogen regulation response regulator NtrX